MADNHKIVAVDENGEEVDEPVVVQGATVDELPSNASFDSISAEDASINQQSVEPQQHSPHDDAPTAAIGVGREQLQHSPAVIGNLQNAGIYSMTQQSSDKTVSTSGSWTEIRPPIGYLSVNVPPNAVPVLRVFARFSNDTAGENTQIAVGPQTQGASGAPITFQSFRATGVSELYDERYLNEFNDGTGVRDSPDSFNQANFRVWAKTTGSSSGAIKPESSIVLDWEVV